jgi:hypothetical protein
LQKGEPGRAHRLAATGAKATAGASATGSAIRILVKEDGLYTVTVDQIATALGVNHKQALLWMFKTQLRLQQKGEPVAWMADPASDRLYFYGQALQGTDAVYAQYNVYWLDRRAGEAMSIVRTGACPADGFNRSFRVSTRKEKLSQRSANDPGRFLVLEHVARCGTRYGAIRGQTPNSVRAARTLNAFCRSDDLAPGNARTLMYWSSPTR